MGYYWNTEEIKVNIDAKHVPMAFAVLKALNTRDDLKHGGSYSKGETKAKWFSWMPEHYDKEVNSLKEIFDLLGFVDSKEDGLGVVLGQYDSKRGQEMLFLQVAAPFVRKDSYIIWKGEDGSRWRYDFNGKKMTEKELDPVVCPQCGEQGTDDPADCWNCENNEE